MLQWWWSIFIFIFNYEKTGYFDISTYLFLVLFLNLGHLKLIKWSITVVVLFQVCLHSVKVLEKCIRYFSIFGSFNICSLILEGTVHRQNIHLYSDPTHTHIHTHSHTLYTHTHTRTRTHTHTHFPLHVYYCKWSKLSVRVTSVNKCHRVITIFAALNRSQNTLLK